MSSPVIRDARPSDIPALAALHVAAWRAAYAGILPSAVLEALSEEEFEGRWTLILRNDARANLVACPEGLAGEPAGFVGYGKTGEIIGLYVHPRRWRRGLGRLLMGAALQRLEARGLPAAWLWVMAENRQARGFYERVGFTVTGRRRESERYGVSFEEVEYSRVIDRTEGPPIP